MINSELSQSDYQLFALKSLLWLVFGWAGFLLSLVGFFYAWLVWACFLAGSIALTLLLTKQGKKITLSRELWLVSIGIFIFVAILSFFTSPTVFSGRDQGSISEAAVRLSQNHVLTFSTPAGDAFFKLRGAGRALNFPGFFYTSDGKLITQFPLVYISWLASFYGIFGVNGLTFANAVLSIWFLFTLYFLARSFMQAKGSFLTMFFAATSLSVYWFPKYTLSENMALPLAWIAIFSTCIFLKKQTKLNLLLLLASLTLLIFTRIEGIAFFLVCGVVIFFNKKTRTYLKNNSHWKFLVFSVFLFLVLVGNTFWDINFYKEIVKAIIPTMTSPQIAPLGSPGDAALPEFYILKIFYNYGMLGFFILATIACIFYAYRKKYAKLVPLFIIAPTLIYFLDSHISPDHPWMLRRFAFSILPGAIFYSALFIADAYQYLISTKKNPALKLAPILAALALLAGNLPATWHFATFAENKQLLIQTEMLSQLFSAKDLILIDGQSTGDGWSMIAAPMNFLFEKNAAYFFNINDLAKLDLKSFDKVYLIAPDSKIAYYVNSTIGNRLMLENQVNLSTTRLDLGADTNKLLTNFPEKKSTSSHITIFKVLK
ncbi:MAG: hypothetical protein WCF93_01895 [Candidatus Moraniibacteriota bacterium]